jgi:mannosyltransferase OCH1-like enzyme
MTPLKIHNIWLNHPNDKYTIIDMINSNKDCIDSQAELFKGIAETEWWRDFNHALKCISESFPDAIPLLEKHNLNPAMVSDIFRYYLMWKYGGLYLDHDVKVYPKLLLILSDAKCVTLFTETLLNSEQLKKSAHYPNRGNVQENIIRIANYILFSPKPGEPFFINAINLALERLEKLECVTNTYDIIWTTGPDIVSTIYGRTLRSNNFPSRINLEGTIVSCTHYARGYNFWKRSLEINEL